MKELNPNQYYKTNNNRGVMHPLSNISRQFVFFSATVNKPVADIGCAYGNTVIAALETGAKKVIACDMEKSHLTALRTQLANSNLASHLVTEQGKFPDDFDFEENSLGAIHMSHILEYLNGDEVTRGLEKCYRWLEQGAKLYINVYSIFIRELANKKFQDEYNNRLKNKMKWPGYFENYDEYCSEELNAANELDNQNTGFPPSLHMFELPILKQALEALNFIIEFADYIDGQKNGAVEETWLDGREYIGIIAFKP